MLESGVIAVTLFVAAVQCGVVPTYQQAPLTTIAKISSPLPYAAPRLTYASSSPILPKYTQVAYASQAPAVAAPVAYATQYAPAATLAYTSAKLADPVTYASHAAPVAYAAHAPAVYSHAPAPVAYAAPAYAKVAAPVAYHAAPGPVAYHAAPAIAKAVVPAAVDTDYDPNPSYNYAYDIQDALTGDSKNQQESRQGDVVQGSYSLTEPDGTRRTVEYTADPVNGFNAVVHREPAAVQKAIVAAPAYAKVAAPVAYASHAPIVAAHAPVAHYSSYH